MLRTYMLLALTGLFLIACGGEPAEPDNPAAIVIPNFSERNQTNQSTSDTDQLMQGLNYGLSSSLSSGTGAYYRPTGLGSQLFFATLTPLSGNPDLAYYRYTGLGWNSAGSSRNSEMLVDRYTGSGFGSNDLFYLSTATQSSFTFSVSWEVNGRLELDVPYLNQNDIPSIGGSACASTSAAMVMAYHAKTRCDKATMIGTAQKCFAQTSGPAGLASPAVLAAYLQSSYGVSSSYNESDAAQIFSIIQGEIRAGRPLILGSHAFSSAGHYLVVTGFNGNDYRTAKIIVNDPNGRWQGCGGGVYCYSIRDNGKGNEYSYAVVINSPIHRILTIRP